MLDVSRALYDCSVYGNSALPLLSVEKVHPILTVSGHDKAIRMSQLEVIQICLWSRNCTPGCTHGLFVLTNHEMMSCH